MSVKHPGHADQSVHGRRGNRLTLTATATARWITPADAQKMQDRIDKKHPRTGEQSAALHWYGKSGSHYMNGLLRWPDRGWGDMNSSAVRAERYERARAEIRHVDEAMHPLPQAVKVRRMVNFDAFGQADPFPAGEVPADFDDDAALTQAGDILRGRVGTVFQEPGFLSTSVKQDFYAGGWSQVMMEIDVPAGTRAAFLGRDGYGDGEHELLLAPGSKLELLSVSDDVTPLARFRVVPNAVA